MKSNAKKWLVGAASVATLVVLAGCGAQPSANNNSGSSGNATGSTPSNAPVTISETGSSLLYPLFNGQWIPAYQSVAPNVQMTAASTGSGAGIAQATQGVIDIGASDAYMADAQIAQTPSMLNIPLAISAQQVMYNLPGLSNPHLNLSGDVLAQIYLGKIKYWDDAAITALNSGVTLPHQPITVVRRSDGSGDTFIFTQYLTDTSAAWKSGPAYGTSISWPSVSTEIGAKGNDGVVAAMKNAKYSIGYVGISWLDKATAQGLSYAALQNQDGKFVLPTTENIQAAATALVSKVPATERISLIDAPGANSYPIINFEYAIVNAKQTDPAKADAIKKFLDWAIDPSKGNSASFMTPVHFLPLPASVEPLSKAQIDQISG